MQDRKLKKKIKDMTSEKKVKEKDIFGEGLAFDSPALAAVKRMFNQLKREKQQVTHQVE